MAYDRGGLKALKSKPSGGRKREKHNPGRGKGLTSALCPKPPGPARDVEHPRSQGGI